MCLPLQIQSIYTPHLTNLRLPILQHAHASSCPWPPAGGRWPMEVLLQPPPLGLLLPSHP